MLPSHHPRPGECPLRKIADAGEEFSASWQPLEGNSGAEEVGQHKGVWLRSFTNGGPLSARRPAVAMCEIDLAECTFRTQSARSTQLEETFIALANEPTSPLGAGRLSGVNV